MQELCEAPGIWAKTPQTLGVWDNVQREHRCGVPVDLEREGVHMEPLVSVHPVCVCTTNVFSTSLLMGPGHREPLHP